MINYEELANIYNKTAYREARNWAYPIISDELVAAALEISEEELRDCLLDNFSCVEDWLDYYDGAFDSMYDSTIKVFGCNSDCEHCEDNECCLIDETIETLYDIYITALAFMFSALDEMKEEIE